MDVKEWGAFSYAPLILYKGIRYENIESWFGKIHVVFSSFFDFSKKLANLYPTYKTFNADILRKLTRIKLKFQQNKDTALFYLYIIFW